MKKALTAESLKKGIMQASPLVQTDCLEGFHSVFNLFAPKLIAYSYIGMYCRYFHFTIFIFFVHSSLLLPICTSYMFNNYEKSMFFFVSFFVYFFAGIFQQLCTLITTCTEMTKLMKMTVSP